MVSDGPRRADLPKILHERERLLRKAIKKLERMFPENTGLVILAFGTHADGERSRSGHMSYIGNVSRDQMIPALRDQADRLATGTADTAGREEDTVQVCPGCGDVCMRCESTGEPLS